MKSVEEMEMKVEGMRKVMGGDKGGGVGVEMLFDDDNVHGEEHKAKTRICHF